MQGFIAIELSKEDAELFINFRKHQDDFKYLLDEGFFDYVGEARIYRDGNRQLRMVNIPKRKKA